MSGTLRPPFNQYPAAFPGPFPFPARGVALPAVPVPDSQPPGVTPVGAASISAPSAPGHLLKGTSGVQTEVVSAHTGMPTATLLLHCHVLLISSLFKNIIHVPYNCGSYDCR
jgi:transcription elongation regulator 1